MAKRLPDVALYVVTVDDRSGYWIVARYLGRFYYLPQELPQLLYDRGESLTAADMAGWMRLVALCEVARGTMEGNPVPAGYRGGYVGGGAWPGATGPLFPEMWLTEAVADSVRSPLLSSSGADSSYCATYFTAVRFRVGSDTGRVEAWCHFPYGSPRGPIFWPMLVFVCPGAGAKFRWPRRDFPVRYEGLQTGSLDGSVNVAMSGAGVTQDLRSAGGASGRRRTPVVFSH